MRKISKNQVSVFLIFSSLLLLLVFLFSWLRSAFEKEKLNLEKELHYAVSDITREIEDSLVHKVFLRNMTVTLDSATGEMDTFFNTSHKLVVNDSNNVFTFLKHEMADKKAQEPKELHFMSKARVIHKDIKKSPGLLPILINLHSDSMKVELKTESRSKQAIEMIMLRFDKYIENSHLPKQYELVNLTSDTLSYGFISPIYHDPLHSVAYGARFPNYFWFILGKMMPQILFCLILFSSISASFYLIYTNWRKQQRLIDIKNDFISNVTHELKTPLSTVGVALEALSDFDALKDPKKTEEYLQISKHELTRLQILVDKVLKMSVFEKDASKLNIEEIDMKGLIQEIIASFKLQFDKLQAHVSFEQKGEHFEIEGDKIHLTNVMYNLIDNALKYSSGKPVVNIRLENHPDFVHLYVADQGLGISGEYLPKIFDRFFRVPTGNRHNVKGHGLGLSYVANVVKKHQGEIDVESQCGEGTTFHISLPRKYVEN